MLLLTVQTMWLTTIATTKNRDRETYRHEQKHISKDVRYYNTTNTKVYAYVYCEWTNSVTFQTANFKLNSFRQEFIKKNYFETSFFFQFNFHLFKIKFFAYLRHLRILFESTLPARRSIIIKVIKWN